MCFHIFLKNNKLLFYLSIAIFSFGIPLLNVVNSVVSMLTLFQIRRSFKNLKKISVGAERKSKSLKLYFLISSFSYLILWSTMSILG